MFGEATETMYIIGQVLGIIAVILGFFSYQMKTAAKLLMFEIIEDALYCREEVKRHSGWRSY